MAATSVDCMYMYEGVWALCAIKLDDKASGVNLQGRTSLSIELELTTARVCLYPVIAKVLGGKFPDNNVNNR